MSTIGRFLEFAVQTPDILESLHFYKSLGFTELESADIYPHKYAVVSDGEMRIPTGDTKIAAGDRVLVYALPEAIPRIEKLFAGRG